MCSELLLYSRWLTLVDDRPGDIATIDLSVNEELTFADLAARVEETPIAIAPISAEACGVAFIVNVLRAWRDGVALVPLENSTRFNSELLKGIPPETAHVKQSSGTTGNPRLILFNESQLAADADQIVSSMELLRYDLNIGVISLAHSYGFSNLVLPLLLHGIPLMLGKSPLPASVKTALAHTDGTAIIPGVPAMWDAWQKTGILKNAPIGLAISAGAPLTLELEKNIINSSGIKIHNFYGSSECGGIAYDYSNSLRFDSNVVGKPINGVTLGFSQDTRLIVRSPAVAMGYWPDHDLEELGNASFQTSDLAESDAISGQVSLLGRAGEMINVAGRKLSPGEVETAISRISGIQCCVVFGVPSTDPHRVEDIVACIAMRQDITEHNLRAELNKILPPWQLPRILWTCNDLAVNSRGKISRSHWRQRFLEEKTTKRSR